jgi:ABC-2 type transport system permease protein
VLWYKAWLETRTRFLLSLIGITALCGFFVFRQDHQALGWASQKLSYYYFAFFNAYQSLSVLWVLAVTLLMMGGLVREKASGAASFTLALPVSRSRLTWTRIAMGFFEAAALGVLPLATIFVLACVVGRPLAIAEVGPYLLSLFGAGAGFFGIAVLAASLVEGEYTPPLIAYGSAVALAIVFGDPKLRAFDPWRLLMATDRIDKSTFTLTGPVPWVQILAIWIIAATLLLASTKLVERREF